MATSYPIVYDFTGSYLSGAGSTVGNPALAFNATRKGTKLIPLDSDTYLQNVVSIVSQWFMTTEQKVPLKCSDIHFSQVHIQITNITISLPSEVTGQASKSVPTGDLVVPADTPDLSVQDALVFLNTAQLYSNRLTEMINQSNLVESIDKWRQLKTSLIEFSKILDKVLQSYKHQLYSPPEIEELKNVKSKIVKLICKASVQDIKKVFGEDLEFSRFDLIAATLGLNRNIASILSEIRKGPCNHQTDLYHFTDIVCKGVEENCFRYDPEAEVFDILVASGFSDAKAELLAEQIKSDELFSHQPLSYWVDWYLEFMFQHDIFLNTQYAYFPHNEGVLNTWFTVPTTRTTYNDSTDDEDEVSYNIQVYNTVGNVHSITRSEIPYPPRKVEIGLWYHATDHESAENIRCNGIYLNNGHQRQDFSDGDGFYLTPYFEFAVEWARRKGGHSKAAILVFRHSVDTNRYNGLDLGVKNDETWSQVVKYYRSGRDSRLFKCPKKLSQEFDSKDYIEGPMSGNVIRCSQRDWMPWKKGGESNQLCIKSQDLADEFSNNIDGIIFISTNNKYLQQ